LDGIAQPAWHLKLDVTVFDDKGKNPSQGIIEVWNAGADQRTVYTFGDASRSKLKHDGKTFYSATGPALPFEAEQVLTQVLHPGPGDVEMTDAVPELRKQKIGKVELDCVMLTQPLKRAGFLPLGLFPSYCMDANGFIRFTYNFGGQAVILNSMGTFLEQEVATEVVIQEGGLQVASAKVAILATYTPQADEFVPGENMVKVGGTARVAGGVIAGDRVSYVAPIYPDIAKMRGASGIVILQAIIGRDGHIHSLRPINDADADFVIAAITAVHQWTYKPYLLNGQPTDVDTTITLNFALRR
jgi:protein TonB